MRADAAEVVRDSVERAKNAAQAIVMEIRADKAVAEEKLEAARPALEDAEAALNTIQPTHIGKLLLSVYQAPIPGDVVWHGYTKLNNSELK